MEKNFTELERKILLQKGREPIDRAKLGLIWSHKDRTHTNYRQLIDGWSDKPDGIDSDIIRQWGRRTHTAVIGWVDAVLHRYASLPDFAPLV